MMGSHRRLNQTDSFFKYSNYFLFLVDGRDSKRDNIDRMRIESRRKYLAKRKDDKIAELEADIVDDEYLFGDEM